MQRKQRIRNEHGVDIRAARRAFSDHEDMTEARILAWLAQFDDADLPLGVRILQCVRYFNRRDLRVMTAELFNAATSSLLAQGYSRIAFVAVGDVGSGSSVVARVLREHVELPTSKLVSMLELSKAAPGSVDAIVFVDDFSGTGMTLERWWENVEPLVRPLNAAVVVGLLVINHAAKARVEQFASIVAVKELDESHNVLSVQNVELDPDAKERLRHYCQRLKAGRFEHGFGDCALLIAFVHGCPNNSLPILWFPTTGWNPLFNRRAI